MTCRADVLPALLVLLLVAVPAAGQDDPDPRGTWVPSTGPGPTLAISDLDVLVPGDGAVLSFFEPASGRLRTLSPAGRGAWTAGPAWFRDSPVTLTFLTRAAGPDGPAGALLIEDGDTVRLRRIAFPRRPVSVRVPASAGEPRPVTLRGEIIFPESWSPGDRPQPLVVLVHGSGPATRELPRPVAELLARGGVAAYVYDKRGTGRSGGSFPGATVADFARDAAAVVRTLAARPEIDPGRVAVLLSSEGGLLLPEIHAAYSGLAAIICRVCPVRSGAETSVLEARGLVRGSGLSREAEEAAARFVRTQQRYALTGEGYDAYVRAVAGSRGSDWFEALGRPAGPPMGPDAPAWRVYRDFIQRDPWPIYAETGIPVLGIFGERDHRVPAWGHAEPLDSVLDIGGHPDSRVRVLRDATHGLRLVEEGTPPYRRVIPGWHEELVAWAAAVLSR